MSFHDAQTPDDLPEEHQGDEPEREWACVECGALIPMPTADPFRCPDCRPKRKLTRNERLQGLADSGVDTLEEYRGEK